MSVELSERRALAVQRSAHTVAAVAGLVVLIVGLSDNDPYYSASWPLTVTALILGAGLIVAGLLTRPARGPRERVLSARVDELSRTRRGALDVQATELRRIERDLHEGGQARLVALSGNGLTGLRQRVEALDGRLQVTSPSGVGTQVEAVLPCGW
jgi:signal transduction histidine kinase